MPGLAHPQYIALLVLLDISLPICRLVRQCLSGLSGPGEEVGGGGGPWGLCC